MTSTPREAALEYIRPYVERGDTLESLYTWQGFYGGEIDVTIGPGFNPPHTQLKLHRLKRGEIGASVGDAWGVFKLVDLYVELLEA